MSFMGDVNICCESKRRLITNLALFKCLVVEPKYLVFNRIRKCRSIKKTIMIKNELNHSRTISFGNNFPHGLSTICLGEILLLPQECIYVDIFFEPTADKNHKFSVNSRFSFFVCGAHPKMELEIPILIKVNKLTLSIPTEIRMPDTSPKVHCYYAFPICNFSQQPVKFNIRLKKDVQSLRYMPCECEIAPEECYTIYLEALSPNMCSVLEVLTLRFPDGAKEKINVEARMVPYMLFPSDTIVKFPCTQIGTRSDEGILLCNESKEIVKFKWCRKESKDGCEPKLSYPDIHDNPQNTYIKQINEYFQIKPKSGIYGPTSSESALISFTPPAKIENQELPAQLMANVYLACSTDRTQRINITLIGVAIGPKIEFDTNELDFGTIFVGEKQFQDVIATNTGDIAGTVTYAGTEGNFGGIASACPQEHELEPLQSEEFKIIYYAKTIGKFMERIIFQVKYGDRLTILVKGNVVPLQIDINPKKIDFGDVPICILRQKSINIFNSLKIPIVITGKILCDGENDPLILMIDENKFHKEIGEDIEDDDKNNADSFSETQSNTHFSFWTYNKSNMECGEESRNACTDEDRLENASYCQELEMIQEYDCEEILPENNCSSTTDCIYETSSNWLSPRSKLSLEFNEVLESTSLIAVNLVTTIKQNKLIQEPNTDAKVLDSVLDEMFTFEYFQRKSKEINYKKMKWSDIPENARELLIQPKPIYLLPNQSVDYHVCLVANRRGPITLDMSLQITPYGDSESLSNDDVLLEVCSKALSMIIPISYNCTIPSLYLSEEILHIHTFVERNEYFSFRIKNLSSTDGFFTLNIIPRNEEAELLLKPRKSYIKANAWRKIHGRVTVFKIGETVLNGLIWILGNTRPTTFKLIVNSKPPTISITPKRIKVQQKVLQKNEVVVDITNTSQTIAKISLSLMDDKYVSVNPKEAILEEGKKVTVTLTSYFYDNGNFKNSLLVSVAHSRPTKIPINYTVLGIPVEFEPNIRENFDMGTVFTSTNPYEIDLYIKNNGQNPYKLFFNKLKNKSKEEEDYFMIHPRLIHLNPKEVRKTLITVKSTNRVTINEEFSVDGAQGTSNKKFHDFHFIFKAVFIRSHLKWSKDEIVFSITNSELCDKSIVSEKVSLMNSSKIPVDVDITATGSFTILDICKGIHGNRFHFPLQPYESKSFEIFFDMKHTVGEKLPAIYEGKIVTKAEGRLQKCLILTARMLYPIIEVNEEDLYFFARKQQFYTFFKITNPGQLTATYKWRLIEEVEYPIDYIQTQKMIEQKNMVQKIVSEKSIDLLRSPVDIDKEYFESMSKFMQIIAESEDESETEIETETKTSASTSTTTTKMKKGSKKKNTLTRNKSSDESMKKRKKSKVENDKEEKPKKGSKKQKKEGETNKTAKRRKSKNKEAESITSTTEKSSSLSQKSNDFLSTIQSKNNFNNYPLYLVKLPELVEEIDSFLKDSIPKEYVEDICDKLAPLENFEEHESLNKHIFLDHYKGMICSENSRLMNIFFSGHNRDVVHKAKYQLEVTAGNCKTVDVTIYNLNATVELSKTKFDFGYQPWYKVHQRKIKLTNRNEMNLKINIAENAYLEKYHKLYKGFVTVNPHGMFYMLNEMICELTIKIYMGFSTKFKDGFGVEVNNNIALPVTFKGRSAIPMLTILNVERPLLRNIDRILEYKTLNKIFLDDIIHMIPYSLDPDQNHLDKVQNKLETNDGRGSINFDEIVEKEIRDEEEGEDDDDDDDDDQDEDEEGNEKENEEEEMTKSSNSTPKSCSNNPKLKDLYVGNDGRVLKYKPTTAAHITPENSLSTLDEEDLNDYHILDYPIEYPNIMQIESMLEMSKFLEAIKLNDSVRDAFRTIANKHVLEPLKTNKSQETKKRKPILIGSFVVHPLPFNTTTYYLPFDYIRINEELLVPLEIFFHGPGKAVFSVRTIYAIPGLTIEFCGPELPECFSDSAIDINNKRKKFLIYNTKPAIIPGLKYMNKTERDNYNSTLPNCSACENCIGCENCEVKICHAHSYDIDLNNVHRREIPKRKFVNEYYSKVNQQYKEEKDPFVLSELYQDDCEASDETIFGLKIKFFPTSEFYEEGSIFEDYIFIDVHLGPSLPILMRGPIMSPIYLPEDLSDLNVSEDSGLDNKSSK